MLIRRYDHAATGTRVDVDMRVDAALADEPQLGQPLQQGRPDFGSLPEQDQRLHVPEPPARPGQAPDFSWVKVPAAGSVTRPDVGVEPREMREHAYALIRTLDDNGVEVGPWDPKLDPETLRRGLRAMMLTRAYDDRMFRAQRQGKTSFYIPCTGEEAIGVAQALALDDQDMAFPTYRLQGLLIARGWPLVDMMNQVFSNTRDRLKGRQMPMRPDR